MLYYIIFALISLFSVRKKPSNLVFFLLFAFFGILIGFRGEDVDNDYVTYLDAIQYSNSSGIQEISFYWISSFFYKYFDSTVLTFVFYGFLGFGLKLFNLKRYANFFWLSFIIYFTTLFILQEMNAMRAGVGAGFMLLSIKAWSDANVKKTILLILVASFFHYSYLILIPLVFIVSNKDKKIIWYVMLIPLAYILYYAIDFTKILMLFKISYVEDKREGYLEGKELITNVYSTVFIIKIIIIGLLYKYRKHLSVHNDYFYIFFKLYCISIFILVATANLPAASMRFLDIFSIGEIFLIPLFLFLFKPKLRWIPRLGIILYAGFYLYLYVDLAKYIRDYYLIF